MAYFCVTRIPFGSAIMFMENKKAPAVSFIAFIIYITVTILCLIFNDFHLGNIVINFLYGEFTSGNFTIKISLLLLFVLLTLLDRYVFPSKSWSFKGLIGFILTNVGVFILMIFTLKR